MSSQQFLFNDIEVVALEDGRHIPTALYYSRDDYKYGIAAVNEAQGVDDLNLGFKMELGSMSDKPENRKKFRTAAAGRFIDAQDLTKDFMQGIVTEAVKKMPPAQDNTTIVMAEPIAIDGDVINRKTTQDRWLKKYRKYIRTVMADIGYDDVQFLPEPFAVYQYYRYGYSHPSLLDKKEYNALVIDFGAGTLDTCIINTTKEGDISGGGRNSVPLAAAAEKVGGYYINEQLAIRTYLNYYKKHNSSHEQRFKDYLSTYRSRKRGEIDKIPDPKKKRLYDNLRDFVYSIEDQKIALSKQITDWRPDAELTDRAPVTIKIEPWAEDSEIAQTYVYASDLKSIFINDVWRGKVKPTIERTLERGEDELKGKPVDLILLSGGTCNLKWLSQLIRNEIKNHDLVDYADTLTLQEYREVVAKGLAIECARQFYTDSNLGDFAETMYNKLNLLLDPEHHGKFDLNRFKPRTDDLPDVSDSPGTLLPSATNLAELTGRKLQWNVNLSSRPSNRLDYRFLKSSVDPEDASNWLNVNEQFIDTPQEFKEGGWDNSTTVQLEIEDDGTVHPTFIYQKSNDYADGKKVDGQPFMLTDMMTDLEAGGDESRGYVGVDFGTSNSSISYIDHRTIEVYDERTGRGSFSDLQTMKDNLPFPLARPLASYLSAPDTEYDMDRARRLFEVAFNFIAALSYVEIFASSERSGISNISRHDKISIGQTWGTLKELLPKLPEDAFASPLKALLNGSSFHQIDSVVSKLASAKHFKENKVKTLEPITYLYNSLARIFENKIFGFFEGVESVGVRRRKTYRGKFRLAHGHGRPFIETLDYADGSEDYSSREAVLMEPESGRAVVMAPFVFWKRCETHESYDSGHCYLFDRYHEGDGNSEPRVDFLSVAPRCQIQSYPSHQDAMLSDTASWIHDLHNGNGMEYFEIENIKGELNK
jgi:molecular chaperone DnaK (HSP70)